MKPTIPPIIAPIPPTRITSAPPVNVTTPPGVAPAPVACGGAELVVFLAGPVNTGVDAGDADAVVVGAVVVITGIAEEVAATVPTGTVLLAWKPAERETPKLAAQFEGLSPCVGMSVGGEEGGGDVNERWTSMVFEDMR